MCEKHPSGGMSDQREGGHEQRAEKLVSQLRATKRCEELPHRRTDGRMVGRDMRKSCTATHRAHA